jgi:hypothetical protein
VNNTFPAPEEEEEEKKSWHQSQNETTCTKYPSINELVQKGFEIHVKQPPEEGKERTEDPPFSSSRLHAVSTMSYVSDRDRRVSRLRMQKKK